MKGLRLILFAYCLLAAVAGSVGIAVLGTQLGREGSLLRAGSEELKLLTQSHEDARDELLALREKQRLERDDYSPQQAIEASANTQLAIDKEARLKLELDVRQQEHESARAELRQRQTRLVPLVALTLLHWLLCPLVFRRRGQA